MVSSMGLGVGPFKASAILVAFQASNGNGDAGGPEAACADSTGAASTSAAGAVTGTTTDAAGAVTASFLAGSIAGAGGTLIGHPLDTLKVRSNSTQLPVPCLLVSAFGAS